MSDHTPNRRPNSLIDSRSPYLLQHAYNPVNWMPWCPEALTQSLERDVLIFLSIGYSACHWCHVMEREVFENQSIAGYMNEHFVNIKVDREERPDLDELYMLATQLTTGSGGWPMSVWLTPQLKPFYAGTYFPPVDQYGRPGFPSVLEAITKAWDNQRVKLLEHADQIAQSITEHLNRPQTANKPSNIKIDAEAWIKSAIKESENRIDLTWGGFSGAPKFPPHQTLLLWITLLESWEQSSGNAVATLPQTPHDIKVAPETVTGSQYPAGNGAENNAPPTGESHTFLTDTTAKHVRTWLTTTLDRMAAGGIFDQIAGGFSRYSTDEQWLVPHFEKMLYDNAQLALIYARAGNMLHRADYQQVAVETLDFWLRDMTAPDGLFYSSLDADSEGVEGKFYVWDWPRILAAIPDEADRQLAGAHWDLTPDGNWEGHNIPRVVADADQLAARTGQSPESVQSRLRDIRQQLLQIRSTRIKPHCDDKILTGWNGLMIHALAEASLLLNEDRYYQAAVQAASSILKVHQDPQGQLLHVSRAGQAGVPAFLEDYACLGLGAWSLAIAARKFAPSAANSWLDMAQRMSIDIVREFYQAQTGRFFISGTRHEQLFVRVPSASDNATPSAAAVAITLMLKPEIMAVDGKYRDIVKNAIAGLASHITQYPLAFSTLLTALVERPEMLK